MSFMDIFHVSKIKQENYELTAANAQLLQQVDSFKDKNAKLSETTAQLLRKMESLGITKYEQTKAKIDELEQQSANQLSESNAKIASAENLLNNLQTECRQLQEKQTKLSKSITSQEKKLSRCRELYKSAEYAINHFLESDVPYSNCRLNKIELDDLELLAPSVVLKLHCMDMKSLRKAYNDNEKLISSLLEKYSSRYSTKANKSIYNLMVIALRAEIQNILYNMKYEKLDRSIEEVKAISAKYLKIAAEGNQSIAGTLTKFIGEVEYLFINSVKIEYNYYVKKEQARQEQLAIKEQMRQEAEERKALENERRKIEQEESKYESQIAALTKQTDSAEGSELEALKARILELQLQLSNVVLKKEEISNLQNGKAGNVYIISNLGSFGNNVFKIGMTRRLNPQDRVNELGDASVPFKFDVHSFIFSDNASDLETELHRRLSDRRVNKVNLRKEFFNVSIDELEDLVTEICPTAEFKKTMIAEEYRQSQSSNEIYTSNFEILEEDDEE